MNEALGSRLDSTNKKEEEKEEGEKEEEEHTLGTTL